MTSRSCKGFAFSPEKDQCNSCGRVVVAGPMGLSRHFARNPQCSLDYASELNPTRQQVLFPSMESSTNRRHNDGRLSNFDYIHSMNGALKVNEMLSSLSEDTDVLLPSKDIPNDDDAVDEEDFPVAHDDSYDESAVCNQLSAWAADDEHPATVPPVNTITDAVPDTSILDAFVVHSESLNDGLSLSLFSVEEKVQVDLLQTLKRLRAPMIAYDEIMKWASRSCSQGHVFRDVPISSRKTVIDKLKVRVDCDSLKPHVKELYLPYSKCFVEVVYFSAHSIFGSFLSCPDLNQDQHYIFNDDNDPNCNPFAKPKTAVISDINTGLSYSRTYDQLIKNEEDMLLPCILAIDKTTCDIGGGGRLSLEPIVVSYGLMKHDVRKTPLAMRVLGFINTSPIHHRNSAPSDRPVPTGTEPLPRNYATKDVSDAAWRLNEYHMQIDCILRESGYLDLQRTGLKWNLSFRGKSFPVVLHPYIPFIIGDTEGHDGLCGHFKSRTAGVAQLCRTCECPTLLSGYSKARNFPHRKPRIINKLVREQNIPALKAMSQQYLKNAFDNVRFGLHNDRGIFGACPGEILHLILIGWFKNVVDSFFIQIGKDSDKAHQYDTLLMDINQCLGRHSDRDVPSTTTKKGFSSTANIPGHEYAGCLFVMLISFYTSRFQEIFRRSRASAKQVEKDKTLSNPGFVDDWKTLLSSLLEWHSWLKQPEIRRSSVVKSVYATSHLMRYLHFVAPRLSGKMYSNTIKTHLVLHIQDDILNFGVPEVMNSSYAESGHISICKDTTRNTQKRSETFTVQAAMRYVENHAIHRASTAIAETTGSTNSSSENTGTAKLKGKRFIIYKHDNGNTCCHRHRSSKKSRDSVSDAFPLNTHVLETLAAHCLPHVDSQVLHCHTEYHPKSGGQIYRAHPNYNGKPWFDHVIVRWKDSSGNTTLYTSRIHTFLDLHNVKPRSTIDFPHSKQGGHFVKPGFYAVIESYNAVTTPHVPDEDQDKADFDFSVFRKVRLSLIPNSNKPILYLVHTDSIVGPTVAIPDAFGDTPPSVGVPSIPNVDYIFLSIRQCDWAQIWESFIMFQEHKVKGPRGYESDDSGYEEKGDGDEVVYVERVQVHQPPIKSGKKRSLKVVQSHTTRNKKGRKK